MTELEARRRLATEAATAVAEAQPLDIARLVALLDRHDVDPRCYDLQGSNAGEQYVVDQSSPRGWSVHYAERGLRSGDSWFTTEADALADLAYRVLLDPTTCRRA